MYRITPARSTPTKASGTASRRPTKSASCCPCAKCRDVGCPIVEGICPPFELRQKRERRPSIMRPNISPRRAPSGSVVSITERQDHGQFPGGLPDHDATALDLRQVVAFDEYLQQPAALEQQVV